MNLVYEQQTRLFMNIEKNFIFKQYTYQQHLN